MRTDEEFTSNDLIQGHQLMALIFVSRLVPITVTFPSITGISVPQDGWIVMFISTLGAIPVVLWINWLAQAFPRRTIVEYSEILLGKIAGKALSLVFVFYLLLIAGITARQVGEAYTAAIMPETPILVFMGVIAFVAGNAAYNGVEVVGRVAETVFWIVLVVTVVVLTLPMNAMRFENLRPVLPGGLGIIVKETATSWIIFLEIIVSAMIVPFLTRPSDARRFSLLAVGGVGLVGMSFAAVLVAVFGVLTPTLTLPAFSLGRLISIGDFLERIEVIPMGIWTVSAGVKMSFFLWAGAVGLAQICGLRRYQPFVYPLCVLSVSLGVLLFDDVMEMERFSAPERSGICIMVIVLGFMTVLTLARLLRGNRTSGDGGEG
ncbi:MAG: endospore germination permease [Firmicutes bacterium]|jgi:spore germination protein KB|nr:endospore germination permease [Bacillota bacterium]